MGQSDGIKQFLRSAKEWYDLLAWPYRVLVACAVFLLPPSLITGATAALSTWARSTSPVWNWVIVFAAVLLFFNSGYLIWNKVFANKKAGKTVRPPRRFGIVETACDHAWRVAADVPNWIENEFAKHSHTYIDDIIEGPFHAKDDCYGQLFEGSGFGNGRSMFPECLRCHEKVRVPDVVWIRAIHVRGDLHAAVHSVENLKVVVLTELKRRYHRGEKIRPGMRFSLLD